MSSSKYKVIISTLCLLMVVFFCNLTALSFTTIDFEQLFEEHGSIMLIIDPDSGEIVYANAVASDFYGYSKQELLTMNINEINMLTPEEVAAEMTLARKEQRNYFLFEHRKKNGETAVVEVHSYPSEISGRQVLFSIITDVTQEKALQQAIDYRELIIIVSLSFGLAIMGFLAYSSRSNFIKQQKHLSLVEASEQKFKQYIENAPDGVSVINSQGQILDVNKALLKMTGYSKEELLDMTSYDLTTQENKNLLNKGMKKLIEEGFVEIEYDIFRKDGQKRFWQVRRTRLENDRFIGFIKDISELREYQQGLIAAKEEAEQAALVKSRFLANMSHEIRTPMNGILGFLQILEQEAHTRDQLESFKKIRISAENLLDLINNILDYSKIESSGFSLEHKSFALHETITESVSLYQKTAEEKNLQLFVRISDHTPQYVTGDKLSLNQILNNLINNSVKFTEGGTIRLTVKPQTKNMISFIVEDTGIGIVPETLNEILDKYFVQEDSSNTRKYGGTGLGIPIVKQLVGLMDGTISIDSKKNHWTRVNLCIRLPEASQNEINHEQAKKPSLPVPKRPEDFHILIVEDDMINAEILKRLLTRQNYQITHVWNGAEALEVLEDHTFDLIFMDCQMPVMDGYEATKIIREKEATSGHPEIPIIALTAHALPGDEQKAFQAGMNEYLTKPINMQSTLETIARYLGLDPEKS